MLLNAAKRLVIMAILALAASSAMANTPNFDIYVVGSMDYMEIVFESVAKIFNYQNDGTIWSFGAAWLSNTVKIAMMLGIFMVLLQALFTGQPINVGSIAGTFIVMIILFSVPAQVTLRDSYLTNVTGSHRIQNDWTQDFVTQRQIDGIPLGLAATGYFISLIGRGLFEGMATNLTPTDHPMFVVAEPLQMLMAQRNQSVSQMPATANAVKELLDFDMGQFFEHYASACLMPTKRSSEELNKALHGLWPDSIRVENQFIRIPLFNARGVAFENIIGGTASEFGQKTFTCTEAYLKFEVHYLCLNEFLKNPNDYDSNCINRHRNSGQRKNWTEQERIVLPERLTRNFAKTAGIYNSVQQLGRQDDDNDNFQLIKAYVALMNRAANSGLEADMTVPVAKNLTTAGVLPNGQISPDHMALYAQQYVFSTVYATAMLDGIAHRLNTVEDHQAAVALRDAINRRNTDMALEGSMFIDLMQPTMAFFEAFFYAISPIMLILVAFGLSGIKMVSKYMIFLIWIQLWPIILVITNLYTIQAGQGIFTQEALSLMDAGYSPTSMYALNSYASITEKYLANAGLMMAATGSLALMLIYGSAVTATALAGRMGGRDYTNETIAAPEAMNIGAVHGQQGMTSAGALSSALNSGGEDLKLSKQQAFSNQATETATAMRQAQQTFGYNAANAFTSQTGTAWTEQQLGAANQAVQSVSSQSLEHVNSATNDWAEQNQIQQQNARAIATHIQTQLAASASGGASLKTPGAIKKVASAAIAAQLGGSVTASQQEQLASSLTAALTGNTGTKKLESLSQKEGQQFTEALGGILTKSSSDGTSGSETWGTNLSKIEGYNESKTTTNAHQTAVGWQSNAASSESYSLQSLAGRMNSDGNLRSETNQSFNTTRNALGDTDRQMLDDKKGSYMTSFRRLLPTANDETLQATAQMFALNDHAASNRGTAVSRHSAAAGLANLFAGGAPNPMGDITAVNPTGDGLGARVEHAVQDPGIGQGLTPGQLYAQQHAAVLRQNDEARQAAFTQALSKSTAFSIGDDNTQLRAATTQDHGFDGWLNRLNQGAHNLLKGNFLPESSIIPDDPARTFDNLIQQNKQGRHWNNENLDKSATALTGALNGNPAMAKALSSWTYEGEELPPNHFYSVDSDGNFSVSREQMKNFSTVYNEDAMSAAAGIDGNTPLLPEGASAIEHADRRVAMANQGKQLVESRRDGIAEQAIAGLGTTNIQQDTFDSMVDQYNLPPAQAEFVKAQFNGSPDQIQQAENNAAYHYLNHHQLLENAGYKTWLNDKNLEDSNENKLSFAKEEGFVDLDKYGNITRVNFSPANHNGSHNILTGQAWDSYATNVNAVNKSNADGIGVQIGFSLATMSTITQRPNAISSSTLNPSR